MIYPQLDEHYKASLILFELGHRRTQCTRCTLRVSLILIEFIIVARVRPRASKGITDLLLPQTSIY